MAKNLALTIPQAKEAVVSCIKAGLVPLLKGSPGMGKSDLIKQIAKEYGLYVIDLRLSNCDPCDLQGFPMADKDKGKSGYLPMDTFPLETDTPPPGYVGWLLFLDEFTSCLRAVQAASYKLVLDRMVGNFKLHPRCVIVAAGNLETDNAIVEEMSTAMQSRLIHIQLMTELDAWLKWAATNKVDTRITSFIRFKPEVLNAFKPDHSDVTFACQRTWEFMHKLITKGGAPVEQHNPVSEALFAGTIGQGVAHEFLLFCKIWEDLLTIEQIQRAPKTIAIPDEPSVLWAVCGSIAQRITPKNTDDLMIFVGRMPVEFQIFTMRDILRRHTETLEDHTAIQNWVAEFSDLL